MVLAALHGAFLRRRQARERQPFARHLDALDRGGMRLLGAAHFLQQFVEPVAIQFRDGRLGLGDFLPRARGLGVVLGDRRHGFGLEAFQLQQARLGDEILVVEVPVDARFLARMLGQSRQMGGLADPALA